MKRVIRLTESNLIELIKEIISEDTQSATVIPKLAGGWLHLTKGDKKYSGCVNFQKFTKDSNGNWKFNQQWAQGLSTEEGKQSDNLTIPMAVKFVFDWKINLAIPDGFDIAKFSANEVNQMYDKWKSGESYVKTIYAKGDTKVNSEQSANTKFNIYFGGPKVNSFCKTKW